MGITTIRVRKGQNFLLHTRLRTSLSPHMPLPPHASFFLILSSSSRSTHTCARPPLLTLPRSGDAGLNSL